MLHRHRRTAALLAGISLSIASAPALAQSASPSPSAAANAAPSPAPSASGAGVDASEDVCAQLGLSPESDAAVKAGAVTETAARTAGDAKASGVKISKGSGGAKTTGSNVASGTGSANESGNPATSCSRGLGQARKAQDSVRRAKAAQATLQAAIDRCANCKTYGIDWKMLAAIGVRETGFQNIDNPNPKDPGKGVFQLTRQPGVTVAQAHDLTFSANYAAKLLGSNAAYLARRFPNLNRFQLLQAAAAAYNFGVDDISGNPNTIDRGSTWNNYGMSIMNMANCF